jgi:predicted transcriptional regulator
MPTCNFYNAAPLLYIVKYRSRTDIVSQILESASGGATKTRIMYKAYLSYAQLKEYLAVLVENGLLELEKGTQTYKTSSKGLVFLKTYSQIGGLMVPDTK